MKKEILLAILFTSLVGVFPVFAQMGDFQKQMMEQMQKQMRQGVSTGQATSPLSLPATISSPATVSSPVTIQAKEGKKLFNDISLGTNDKSCGSCHREGEKPLDGSTVEKRLIAAVQYCYEHAIGGQKIIPADKLDDLIAYFSSLGNSAPPSALMPTGSPTWQPQRSSVPGVQTPSRQLGIPPSPAIPSQQRGGPPSSTVPQEEEEDSW